MELYIVTFTRPVSSTALCWANDASEDARNAMFDASEKGHPNAETGRVQQVYRRPEPVCEFSSYLTIE